MTVPNTQNGISIVTDKPMNNGTQLDINKRAVLRQYYVLCQGALSDSVALIPVFGYKNSMQAEGTDFLCRNV